MKQAFFLANGIYTPAPVTSAAINLAKEGGFKLYATFLDADQKGPDGGYLFPNDLALTTNILTGKSVREENEKNDGFCPCAF